MTDYWSKLELNECWSEKQRFNIIMDYIDTKLNGETPTVEDNVQVTKDFDIIVGDDSRYNNPIPNAVVKLTVGDEEKYSSITDDDGIASFNDVEYGAYDIIISAEGYNELVDGIVIDDGFESEEFHLTNVGEETNDEPNVGNVSVKVVDEKGEPVPNADVSIYSTGEPYESTTGKAGGCTIRNVPYGEYTIEAVAEGYDFTVETITVDNLEIQRELILKPEVDDNI